MLGSNVQNRLGRGFVILAPSVDNFTCFTHATVDPGRHERLLASSQRLRGRIYRQDGAIAESQLTADGRHLQAADESSWHLMTVNPDDHVTACLRFFAHPAEVPYSSLAVAQLADSQTAEFSALMERAVGMELARARRLGFSFVELGGWVVDEELRCSTEAVRILLLTYAFSQLLGGAIGLSTATTRHSSSSILRRTGGTSLADSSGNQVPSYFDPFYNCEMELLGFDSRHPNPRYSGWIREFRAALQYVPVLTAAPVTVSMDLCHLHDALAGAERSEPALSPSLVA